MLSITRIAPGAGVDYVLRQVATGRHDFRPAPDGSPMAYFADPEAHGEAPGWWAGQSSAMLGVTGTVTDEQARLLIGEGRHPVSGRQLGRQWRRHVPMTDEYRKEAVERAWKALPADATYEQIAAAWLRIWTMPERRAVAGFDVTVSPVKSVSIVWAFGDDAVKAQVMAAHHAGVRSALAHLRQHGAFTRLGTNGVVQVDTDGLAAMVFDHRMSREKDPQLHSHIIVSSKVRIFTAEGRQQWLSLDSRAFYQASIGARAAYERAVEVELGRRLGVAFVPRPGSQIREVLGIDPAAIRQYSKRRAAIEAEMDHRTAGADGVPEGVTGRRWRRRAQDATLRTRRPKEQPESTRDAVRRWGAEDRQAGLDTAAQVRDVLAGRVHNEIDRLGRRVLRAARSRPIGRRVEESDLYSAARQLGITDDELQDQVVDAAVRHDPRLAVHRAVRELEDQQATWRLDHLELAIGRHLHVDPNAPVARDWRRVTQLAAQALNTHTAGLRPLNPPALMTWTPNLIRSSDRQPVYTRHRDLWMTTDRILAAEQEVIAYAARRGATPAPTSLLDRVSGQLDLSAEKRDALRFLLGDDRRITGIVGPAGTGKTYLQRAVGVAAQQAGVPVLGLTVGQNAAQVLASASEEGGLTGIRTENIAKWLHAQHSPPEDSRPGQWEFQPGQWVIVDEASQASSTQLAALVRLLAPVHGKLLLVGDPAQVSAVGPGGLFRYLDALGASIQLREVRRFTEAWEGPASLRLRDGDTTVVAEYDRRGRIRSGHREDLIEDILDGWAADVLAGRDALILVETEAEAADIAAKARLILRRAGIVPAGRTVTLADGTHAGVGDLVVTRRNDRRLVVEDGARFVANRDQWKILAVGPDGSLHVQHTRTEDVAVLPAAYVAQDVQLAYAATVDSAQGRTVHAARALVDEGTDRSRLYVMMTRGSLLNQLYVAVDDEPPEGHQPATPKAAISVVADILRRDDTDRSATETEQTLWADHDNLYFWGQVYEDLGGRANEPRYAAVVRAVAGSVAARRLVDDPAMSALATRLTALAQAGYDPEEVLAAAAGQRELDSARDVAAVLAWRIDRLYDDVPPDPTVALSHAHAGTYTTRVPETAGEFAKDLRKVAQICDSRVRGLAEQAAALHPAWSTALGPVPDDGAERGRWLSGARVVLTYRDRYQITSDDPIGPEPSTRDPARWAAWTRAQTVLGVATLTGQIRAATDPELRAMVDAQRAAETTAPPYVAGALRTAHVALVAAEQHHRELRLALAAAETTATRQGQLAVSATPRWWHVGPLQTRAAAQHATAQAAASRAQHTVDDLRTRLADAATQITERRANVADLEAQHRHWTGWYQQALPTRYTGLAAAAETALRTQRATDNTRELINAVRDTVDKVRAVDTTRPKPHHHPVPDRLPAAATAGRDRAAALLDSTSDESRHDLDPGPSIDI